MAKKKSLDKTTILTQIQAVLDQQLPLETLELLLSDYYNSRVASYLEQVAGKFEPSSTTVPVIRELAKRIRDGQTHLE